MTERTVIDMEDSDDGFKPNGSTHTGTDSTDIDDYDASDLSVEDSQGVSDDTTVFDLSEDGTLKDPVIDDVDEGGDTDGKDSDGKEKKAEKSEKKERNFKVEIDTEKAKKYALKEAVEPVANQVFERITTDKDTIKMIEDWKKLSRKEKRAILRADESMIMDGIKGGIPFYQFYHMWKMLSAGKKRALVYYGVLPMEESEIREIEASYGLRDKVAAVALKAVGFFLPEFKVLDPYVAAYVGSAEFNTQLARNVRASVREKLHMHEARTTVHDKAVKAAA